MSSLADLYCNHHGIPPDRFARHALVRSLTWQATLLYPVLRWWPGFFAADLEFIRTVGRARNLRDFMADAIDFKIHPDNSRFLRRTVRLRVSSRRLRRLLHATLAAMPEVSRANTNASQLT